MYNQYSYTCELCDGKKEIDTNSLPPDYPSLFKCSSCIKEIQKTMVSQLEEASKNGLLVVEDDVNKYWYIQELPFKTFNEDWNCDGDFYHDTVAPFNIMVPNPNSVERITISKNQIGKGNDYEIINLPLKE